MLPDGLKRYHDRVVVLTIRSARERQAEATRQLGTGNFEFFDGVDKADTSLDKLRDTGIYDEAAAIHADRNDRTMRLGEVCCAMGHRGIYEEFLASDGEKCLIFEDDVVVDAGAVNRVDEVLAAVPKDAELIYWGWLTGSRAPWFGPFKQAAYHISHMLGFEKYDHTMIGNLYARTYNDYFDEAGKHFGAHAYTVTRAAARVLVEMNTPIIFNADNLLMQAVMQGKVRAYICRDALFTQRSVDPNDPLVSLTQS